MWSNFQSNYDVSSKVSLSMSRMYISESAEFTIKQPINFQSGKLQVLGPKEELDLHSCDAASRPGRQGSAGRKYCTPTKQISLCTVKPIAQSHDIPDYNVADDMQSENPEYGTAPETSEPQKTDEKVTAGLQSPSVPNHIMKEQPEESSDEEESDDDKGGAPIELLAEFLKAVMDEDYKVAQKLCQMVLLYEPENPEAKQFSPLIEKMVQKEEEQSSDDEDSEETDEDGSDTDDSEDQSTDTSEDSSEDEMNT
ncbi:glutamate-rich protein 2 isoform X2 [Mixophyes fleayi]|uniref:glutamate-rich protein 2 isoform X2 n=1 Tax=Mixophyes fleayi TaxID=3061075 RepID=UPI003F4DC624